MLALAGIMAAGIGTWDAARGAARDQQDLDVLRVPDAPPDAIWIDSLDLSKMVQRRQTKRR